MEAVAKMMNSSTIFWYGRYRQYIMHDLLDRPVSLVIKTKIY
jgi:hypothetical protein